MLSESFAETMRSFYKLRTAYKTLEGIHATLVDLQPEPEDAEISTSSSSSLHSTASSVSIHSQKSSTSTKGSRRSSKAWVRRNKMSRLSLSRTPTAASCMARDEVERFTASGCNLCFGLLLLLLGMVPPSLGRVMSIVGFRGGITPCI